MVLVREWYRPREVVKLTGWSRTTVYDALWSGRLKGHQPAKGQPWRISVSALREWMDGTPEDGAA